MSKVKLGGGRILSTNNLGVVGAPIQHSKSPQLHLAAYEVLGLDWSYTRSEVLEADFETHLAGLDDSWRGLSVTMPLKGAAFACATTVDAHASYTGAVNTLAFSRAGGARSIRGYNTDVYGITSAVTARGINRFDHATIIGAGATAQSALVALDELGFESATVVLRDIAKADSLVKLARVLGFDLSVQLLSDMETAATTDLAISTVPGSANVSLMPLKRSQEAVLLDVAYDVWPSPRAEEWSDAGGKSVSGLSMLAYQALKQVRIFVAEAPDEPLSKESEVAAAMFAAVGLDEHGL